MLILQRLMVFSPLSGSYCEDCNLPYKQFTIKYISNTRNPQVITLYLLDIVQNVRGVFRILHVHVFIINLNVF